jgi:hypothetical protein
VVAALLKENELEFRGTSSGGITFSGENFNNNNNKAGESCWRAMVSAVGAERYLHLPSAN